MKNSTLFSIFKVLCAVAGFLTISHFTQAQTLKTATGSANNFILTMGQNLGGSYPAGLSFTFISNQTITGAATINVNSTGVKNLVKNVNQSLAANDILAGQAVQVLYDGTNFQVLNVGSASTSTGAGNGKLNAFRATSTNIVVPNAYNTIITIAGEAFDTDNNYNPTTGRFVVSDPGYYSFDATIGINVGAGNYADMGIKQNGTYVIYGTKGLPATADGFTYMQASGLVYANVGDYFQVLVSNVSGSAQTIYQAQFQGFKINGGSILTVTSFSGSTASGISSLNGLTSTSQSFSTSSTGTSINIVSSGNTHNFNVPLTTLIGGNNITVTGTFPVYTISGLASTSTGAGSGSVGAFSARINNNKSVTTTSGTSWDVVDYNSNNWFNPTTGRYSPQEAGYYHFISTFRMGSYSILPSLYKNGTPLVQLNSVNLNYVDYSNGSDYYEIRADGNALGDPNPSTQYPTYFQAYKINGGGTLTVSSFVSGSSTTGISALNGLTTTSQSFSTSSTGTSINIASSGNTHNLNIPLASVVGGNNITVTGSFPLYTVSGLASTATSQWVPYASYATATGISYLNGVVFTNKLQPATNSIFPPSRMDDVDAQLELGSSGITENVEGDMYLRGYWGVNIDRHGGNSGFIGSASAFPDNGTFAVRYRSSNTSFRTDLLIDASGNVGIGNTSPSTKLDVTGNARISGLITLSSLATGGVSQALGVNNLGQLVTISGASASISSLNGLTSTSQNFNTSSTGTSVNIVSSGNTHNFNIPLASVVGGNNITVTGTFPLYTVSGLAGGTSTSQWVSTTGGIYYNGGNIGLGIGNPLAQAHVYSSSAGIGKGLLISGNNGALNLGDVFGGNPLATPTWSLDNVNGQFRIYSQPNLTTAGTVWMTITSASGAIAFPTLATGSLQALGVNNVGQLVTIPGASSSITSINNLTTSSQSFASSSTGTSVNIISSGNTHNFNIPLASIVGGNNITVTGSFPLYTVSGLAGGTSTSQWVSTTAGIYYSTGNVGIGTNNPTQKLHLSGGNALITGTANFSTAGDRAYLYLGDVNHYISAIDGSGVSIGTYSKPDAVFLQQVSGNLGIGTTAPGTSLDVNGNARFNGPVTISGLAGATTQALGVNNLGQLVTISGTTSTTQWVSDAGGIYYNNGSVSVGTTSNATFAPLSSAKPNGMGTIHTSFGATDGANSTFRVAHPIPTIGILGVMPGQDLIVSTIANDNNSFTPLTIFKSNGTVGIGSTTPGAMLDVNGNARFAGPVSITGLATGGATQALGVNNLGQLVTITGGTNTSQWVSTTGGSIFYNNGNIGVGTNSPSANVEVSSSIGSAGMRINSTNYSYLDFANSGVSTWGLGSYFGTFYIDRTGFGNLFSINSTGLVSLGNASITTPGVLLRTNTSVTGSLFVSGLSTVGGLKVNNLTGPGTVTVDGLGNLGVGQISGLSNAISSLNTLTTSSQTFSASSTGTSINITSLGSVHNFNIPVVTVVGGNNVTVSGGFPSYTITGKPNTPSNWTDSGIDTYHYTGGKVGINTNNPLSRLEVRGNNSSTSTSGAEETVRIGSTDNTALRLGIWMQTDPIPNNQYMALNAISSGNRSLLLQSTGGNVGIGPATALPNEKLTVQGNISTTGTIFAGTIVGNNLAGASGSIVTVDGLGKLGIGSLPATSSSQWVNSAATTPGIYYTGGKVGIGLSDPTHFSNVSLIVRGATAPQAVFGDNQSGVTITAGNPGIWFNSYFYSGGMRNMIGGYASSLGQNPSSGVFSLNISTATGTANNINPSIVAYNIYPTGNTEFLGLVTSAGLTVKNLIGPGTVTVDGFGRMGVSTTSGGSISGSGTTNGVAFWSNGNTLTADGANFVYTPSAKSLKVGNAILSSNSLSGNVFFGVNVGNQTMSGTDNNFYGTNIGQSNTSGKSNNFLGNGAGQANNTGSFNNFLGEGTGNANTGGNHNFYAGYQAGGYNISGSNNTYIGQGAGGGISGDGNNYLGQFAGSASTGSYNNFFGSSAGGTNTSGTDNIFIGQSSGLNNTTGSQNVAIGKSAGFAGSNITNGVALGAFATVGGSNMVALGGTGANAVSVGIGTGLPQNTIDVVGGARIRSLSVSGAVFANANGDLYVSTASSSNLWTISGSNLQPTNTYGVNLTSTTTSYMIAGTDVLRIIPATNGNNVLVGGAGNPTISTSGNVLVGQNAGSSIASGGFNTFMGDYAGTANNSGGQNTFYGFRSGASNNSGSLNTFIGYFAGNQNTSGGQNTFMGVSAGNNNSNGFSNTFIGYSSGALNNTGGSNSFFGSASGNNNTSGSDNAFHGFRAGFSNSVASGNSFLGSYAGHNSTGANNTAIGFQTDITGAFTYAIALGAGASVNGSNMMSIGGAAGSGKQVSVGIGTGLPQNTIDVVGGARIRNLSVSGAVFANANGDLYISTTGGGLSGAGTTNGVAFWSNGTTLTADGANFIYTPSSKSLKVGNAILSSNSAPGNVFFGGVNSGNQTMSGSYNYFFGNNSGFSNTSGSFNYFMGELSGFFNTSGYSNLFIGQMSGENNTTGNYNIAIGYLAGQANSVGNNNILIGYSANVASNNLTNAIAIGSNAIVGGNNMMALGGTGANAISVGIGTGLPQNTIDVVGGARIRNLSVSGAVFANASGDLYVNTATSANLWTVSGTSLTPSTASYGVNVGTNVTTTGLVNISSTTNSGMVISSYSIPANTGALMVNSYSSSTAGIGGFVTGPNAVGIYGQATNGLSSAIEGNNTGGGSAIKATGTGAVSPVVQIDNNGSGGTGLRINLSQGLNTATGLMIISSSTTTSQAMDITGKIQFRNYTSGTLTVDGLGNLGVSTATSNVGAGSGFLATSTVPQANISSGVWTLALFGNEVFDDASKYDNTTTFDYTAPANGVYQINASVPFSNIGQVDIAIAVNAVNMIVNSASTSPNTGIVTSIPISGILKLTSGQKVTIQVRQFTGGLVGTASSNTGANASFSMVKLY